MVPPLDSPNPTGQEPKPLSGGGDAGALNKVRDAIKKQLQRPHSGSFPTYLFDELEKQSLENSHKKALLARTIAGVESLKQDTTERKKYAQYIFWMIVGWLITVMVLLFLIARGVFNLSDAVLITLITTTTANITAFFFGVVRYLFPNRELSIKHDE